MKKFNRIVLDPFCHRQFQQGSSSYIPYNIKQFQQKANQYYQTQQLKDGYAPFCKHIFIPNFTSAQKSVAQITQQNQKYLKTIYEARTLKQLPVLRRYFPKQLIKSQCSKYLDIILYSKQQIIKENQAMGNKEYDNSDYDYGIISVKPQDQLYQTPMDPITIMRNSLGKQHGGSGVELNKQKYLQSVQYWSKYAIIK